MSDITKTVWDLLGDSERERLLGWPFTKPEPIPAHLCQECRKDYARD